MAQILLIFLRINCCANVLFSTKTKKHLTEGLTSTCLGFISNSKFMARLSDWMGSMAGLPPPPGSATAFIFTVVLRRQRYLAEFSQATWSWSGIHVEGMRCPNDVVACRDDRQLYVADSDNCVWKVSVGDQSYAKWQPTESTTGGLCVWTLSLTSRRLLVTSHTGGLYQYSTTDRQLLRVVKMPGYVKELHHSVETARGTFVVCHQGCSRGSEMQSAVSELIVAGRSGLACPILSECRTRGNSLKIVNRRCHYDLR